MNQVTRKFPLRKHDFLDEFLGGDADTLACITGGIAGAFYGGVPKHIAERAWALLDERMRTIVTTFCVNYRVPHLPGQ